MRWLDGITDSMDMNLSKLREMRKAWEAWHAEVMGSQSPLVTEQQETTILKCHFVPEYN